MFFEYISSAEFNLIYELFQYEKWYIEMGTAYTRLHVRYATRCVWRKKKVWIYRKWSGLVEEDGCSAMDPPPPPRLEPEDMIFCGHDVEQLDAALSCVLCAAVTHAERFGKTQTDVALCDGSASRMRTRLTKGFFWLLWNSKKLNWFHIRTYVYVLISKTLNSLKCTPLWNDQWGKKIVPLDAGMSGLCSRVISLEESISTSMD